MDFESDFERRSSESMTLTRARCLPSLLTSIQALELLIAERILFWLELVAVALIRGVCCVLHSLPEFRHHQRLVSYVTP